MKELLAAVEALAEGPGPSKTFAVEVVAVLRKHRIALPEKLSVLKVSPQARDEEMTEGQQERLSKWAVKLVNLCRYAPLKGAPGEIPAALRFDLLAAVAEKCPSYYRTEAALALANLVFPDCEGRRSLELLAPPALAARAIDSAVVGAVRTASGRPTKSSILAVRLAWMHGLTLKYVMCKALAAGDARKETLEKFARELAVRIKKAAGDADSNPLVDAVTRLVAQIEAFPSQSGRMSAMLSDMVGVGKVIKGFFAAVNTEDRQAVAKFITKKMAARLAERKSIRAAITSVPNAKAVRFKAVGPVGTLGDGLYVPVHFVVVDAKGRSKQKAIYMFLVRTKTGFLLGQQ